ncbi:GIY-YIG nuclease family protein [Salimicrobium halophilum]|uniref:GIY-YIG nuclease family protein n=1 Tax=Salimicrobium halophilum TaxID=86666 RepID=UPI000B8A56C9|nr:GIY-YIG nuclease family protein [Salimicrobium halophilum]
MDEHYVYILECRDGTFYTGYTNDLKARMKKHENGEGAKYTRGRGPFALMFSKCFASKSEAMKEEYRIKRLSRMSKERLIREGKEHEKSKELPTEERPGNTIHRADTHR